MAKVVWALQVVRADLSLEMRHIGGDDELMRKLDREDFFARLYFLRGSLLSLTSGCILLNRLMGEAEFKVLLVANPEIEIEFLAKKKEVNRAQEEFTRARDVVAGHIETSVVESLARVPADHVLKIETTKLGLSSGPACIALMATLFPDVAPGLEKDAAFNLLKRLSEASGSLFRAIELALALYDRKYPLYPSDGG